MNKFLYKNEGSIDEIFLNALNFAYSFNQPIHLVFPKKGQFESTNIGKLLDNLTPNLSKKLSKGGKVNNLDFLLPNQINDQTSQGIVLAVYCTLRDMNKITSDSHPDSNIIYISWNMEEANNWENIWKNNGLEIKHGTPNNQEIVLNPKVEEVLRRLTNVVNLTTGLAHPSDKKSAINEFKKLKQLGIKENPEYIGNWALANGWNARHIDDLKKLATQYLL